MAETFDSWAIVEIMGHQTFAGRVTEQTLGGASFVRVDVPAVGNQPAYSKIFGAGSIYCITPVTEEIARKAVEQHVQRPVNVYGLPAPRAALAPDDEDYDDEDDDG